MKTFEVAIEIPLIIRACKRVKFKMNSESEQSTTNRVDTMLETYKRDMNHWGDSPDKTRGATKELISLCFNAGVNIVEFTGGCNFNNDDVEVEEARILSVKEV